MCLFIINKCLPLGEGHFGVVKRARHVFTGQRVAVKVIDKTKLYNRSDAKEAKEQLVQEVQCMKLVKHTNVVTLYQVGHTDTIHLGVNQSDSRITLTSGLHT